MDKPKVINISEGTNVVSFKNGKIEIIQKDFLDDDKNKTIVMSKEQIIELAEKLKGENDND